MSIKATLETLLGIKELLAEERAALDVAASVPRSADAVRLKLQGERDKAAAARARAREAALRGREVDAQLRANDTQIARYKGQLPLAKNQQQMDALQGQIAGLQGDSAKLEDEGLALVETEEAQRLLADQLEAALTSREVDAKAELDRLEGRRDEAMRRAELARTDRARRASALDDATRSTWERLVERHGATAMVPLVNLSACGGCDMSVVMRTAEAARRMDELTRCESCGRVLYDPEQVKAK